MKLEFIASFIAAVLFHVLLLFGLRLGTPARPLAVSDDTPVEVNLVAAAPEPPAVAPPPEPVPPPPKPEIPPPPEPVPVPREEPMIAPAPQPPQKQPKPRSTVQQPRKVAPSNIKATASGPATTAQPRYRSNPKPDYPEMAKRMHQQGLVLLSVEVGADGRPQDVSLKHSSGFSALDQAAIQAVRRWSFEPARVAGMAIASRVDVPVRFSLSDSR